MIPGTLTGDSSAIAHSKDIVGANSLRLCHKTLSLLYDSLWQRHLLIACGVGGMVSLLGSGEVPFLFDAKKEIKNYLSHESMASFQ